MLATARSKPLAVSRLQDRPQTPSGDDTGVTRVLRCAATRVVCSGVERERESETSKVLMRLSHLSTVQPLLCERQVGGV